MGFSVLARWAALASVVTVTSAVLAQDGAGPKPPSLVEVSFKPTGNAQLAIWIEDGTGEYLKTVALTEATALRGIGNRPGASQMNSGFRWPYGRREGVLPTWAMRRASAPGAALFRRVIFQDRRAEGLASRTSSDYSKDDYFCLSFDKDRSAKDALDAVSCATVFNSDKGRFITEQDVQGGYAEPFLDMDTDQGVMEPLGYYSMYPPRRDVTDPNAPRIHPDVAEFRAHALQVMPEIDEVTMATPLGDRTRTVLFRTEPEWTAGDYRACIEVNVEGDYNEHFNADNYPTPTTPTTAWDSWAMGYGYPYRGQPSVVYCVPFQLGTERPVMSATSEPDGSVATWDTRLSTYGELRGMDLMTDDPQQAPGQGADRLQALPGGNRLEVRVRPPTDCSVDAAPTPVGNLRVRRYGDELHAHEWIEMQFTAADDDQGIYRYDVRVSEEPIEDEASFMRATPAKAATVRGEELVVPVDMPAGQMIEMGVGGLNAETEYFIAVRAYDECANGSPLATEEFQTPARTFTTVTPCFVATATYGHPLAKEIGALRRFRDRHLLNQGLGRAFVDAYYRFGPELAAEVREHGALRTASRLLLTPFVKLAGWVSGD